jgi:muconolactone delta-isomerase
MKFLIVSKNKHLTSPEVASDLFDATLAWARKYERKLDQIWGFAGLQAGGGVVDVESLEELDAILAEFPLGPFGETEVYPLVDIEGSFQRKKQVEHATSLVGQS